MMDFENREFGMNDTLHSKETEMIRIRAAQVIAGCLLKMDNPKEPAAVISLVIADLVDRQVEQQDEVGARAAVAEIANAALHVWGAANGIDIPLEKYPPFPRDELAPIAERLNAELNKANSND